MKPSAALTMALALFAAAWTHATYAQSCTITAALDFGSINTFSATPTQTQGTMTVTCTGIPYPYLRVCTNLAGNSGPRYMVGPGSAKLRYELYTDATRTTVWGSYWGVDPPVPIDVAISGGSGTAQKTVYGTVFPGQTASPAGSYSASLSDSILIGTYSGSPVTGVCTNGGHFSQYFTVTSNATVTSDCTLSATNVDFGQSGVLRNAMNSTGVVTTTCTAGTTYTVSLGAGMGAAATVTLRRMTRSGGSETLGYTLYRDSGRTQVWGDGTGGSSTVSITGTGSAQTSTVYATVPMQTTPLAGSYVDTVIVTVTF